LVKEWLGMLEAPVRLVVLRYDSRVTGTCQER
jgi:hypothetical protein